MSADLRPEHLAELERSGISPELAAEMGLRSICDADAEEFGFRNGGRSMSGLLFPFLDPATGEPSTRFAVLKPDHGMNGSRYLSPVGEVLHLYFPPGTRASDLADISVPVLGIEGIKKAIAVSAWARRAGVRVLVVGILGCWGWRRAVKGGLPDGTLGKVDSKPITDLDLIAWTEREVTIGLDGDVTVKRDVAAAERALVRELERRGAKVKVLRIPPAEDGSRRGADDYIVQEGDDAWARLVDEARPPMLPTFPQTDAGSGELIANLYGDRLRYDHRRGRWLLWSGHYWTADCEATIRNMAIEAARWRYQRASSITDLKAREGEAKFAIKCESRAKVEDALYFAKAIKPIADRGENWDRQPHLLGCPNGIVDLKTGILRPGRPEDRITMTTGIEFDPEARAPRWEQFLVEIFSGADELIDWIHRAIGHSATGDTSEQIVCILHGDGCNGKSVFCSTLRHVLGDYAHTMPFSTVEDGTRRAIPNDVAALVNRRFVFASETKENRRLNEARIKELTGGDAIPARFLNHEWFTFQPVLKPWLAVNHLPLVEDLSFGFWRRVRLIPFTRQFKGDQDDKHLTDTLKSEAPGILAWIARGAVRWYAHGLVPVPDAVQAATDLYERSSDELGEYVAERLFVHDDYTTRAGDLFKNYISWADDRGMKTSDRMTATAFGRSMGKRFRKTSDRHGTTYHGIGLPAPDEQGPTHD